MWIWETDDWPRFKYDLKAVLPAVEDAVRATAPLIAIGSRLNPESRLQLESKALFDEIISTSLIEGEVLDRESVRSSIANRLGIGEMKRVDKSSQNFVDILLESVRELDKPVTEKELLKWHDMMFEKKSYLYDITAGDYRNEEMSVVSGRPGKEVVHFQAPCSNKACVRQEMSQFWHFFNNQSEVSGYVKAAVAKLMFVTIHPFDDGNGRLSRMVAERVLAETEGIGQRLYSISSQIEQNKDEYYEALESTQKGGLDITNWIVWFLKQVELSAIKGMDNVEKIQLASDFWSHYSDVTINERQRKCLKLMLGSEQLQEGLARRKYKKITSSSDATSARDLADLADKGILEKQGEGRSTMYVLTFKGMKNSSAEAQPMRFDQTR